MTFATSNTISRREFTRLAGRFGATTVMLALAGLPQRGDAATEKALQATSASLYKKRFSKAPRFKLRFGAAHFTRAGLDILPNGSLAFIADLEERTDGEIQVEYLGGNQLCNELQCTKMCINDEIDFFSASTQNASAGAPYFNVLDFAYLWPSRASMYHFFYHPDSEPLLREPLRKYHHIEFLFAHAELRGFMMGLKYSDQPLLTTLEDLQGAKVRVTGTQLGRITLKLLGLQPVPVPWDNTLHALRVGAIDGGETWSSAVPYGGWGPVITQDIHSQFMAGNAMTGMSSKSYNRLGPELQQAVKESAYLTQINIQKTSEAKLLSVTGISNPPLPGSYYAEHGINNVIWSPAELEKAKRMSAPRHNPEPWNKWRERLNRMAGGIDTYEHLYQLARELPEQVHAVDVEPRRWWR